MEINLDIDNDFCDAIVAARLLQTYKSLKKDLEEKNWGKEDLKQFAKIVKALEVVGPWYVYGWEWESK